MELIKTETGFDVNFDCPQCGHNLEVDARGMGLKVPCPECGEQIEIPRMDVGEGSGGKRIPNESLKDVSPPLKLSNISPDGSRKRCAFCRQYMYVDAVICPACGYDQIKHKKHRTRIRRGPPIQMPWGVLVSCLLLFGFIYVVFYSAARPDIPRTRKLLKTFCEKLRPAEMPSEGNSHP
ncbi:MAG: zinc ribbon domain-containing protein [Kiritimatiellae bacterium]|nr:zinc ribbon domain-containing protein [Kiritimatiellia bacterium]